MTALTKAHLAEYVNTNLGLNKKDSKQLVEAFFEEIKSAFERGEKVKISGFGNFELHDKPERPGRNPKTGEPVSIAPRRVVTFKASRQLKASLTNAIINQSDAHE